MNPALLSDCVDSAHSCESRLFVDESKLWNRAAAAAERLWSPAATRDPECAQRRLWALNTQMKAAGLRPAPLQPEYCRQNPGVCDNYAFTAGSRLATCSGGE